MNSQKYTDKNGTEISDFSLVYVKGNKTTTDAVFFQGLLFTENKVGDRTKFSIIGSSVVSTRSSLEFTKVLVSEDKIKPSLGLIRYIINSNSVKISGSSRFKALEYLKSY